jgi:predicted anti-sigma-YlaC factor YlaD
MEHPLEFLPELALGVLPAIDAAAVVAHISTCESCRAEHDEMARVTAMLPLATADLTPSQAVKAGLMERISREPRATVPLRRQPWRWSGAAASAAALLAVGTLAGFVIGQSRSGSNEDQLQAQIRRQSSLVQAAAKGTMLTSEATNGGAWAAVVRAPGATWGYVWVDGLPTLPTGKVYQAWFTRDGKAFEPSATFTFSEGGVWVWADSQIDSYAGLGLTIEDAAGGKTPSEDPFVKVAFGGSSVW